MFIAHVPSFFLLTLSFRRIFPFRRSIGGRGLPGSSYTATEYTSIRVLMRDEKEGRKKEASKVKQTNKAKQHVQHTQGSHFS